MKFIFQLICIVSPTPGPPGKTFFPQGKSFSPSQVKQIPKLSLSFYVNLSLLRISQLPRYNQENGKQSWLTTLFSFKISLKDTYFHISINFLGLYLSPECSLNFLSNLFIPLCRKNFEIYGVHIPRKCIDLRHFYACPFLLKTRRQNLVIIF